MIPKHLEFVRFDTLKELYDKLIGIEFLKDKIQLCDEKIEIKFHDDFVLTIKPKAYFNVYMNNVFYYDIEEQDIWYCIHEIINDDSIFIESDGLFKRKTTILDRDQFEKRKEKLMNKQNVKIYTTKELIYNSN